LNSQEIHRTLTARLEGSLKTLRNLYLANGLLQIALRLFVLLVVLFLLDYSMALPRTVRTVLLALSLGYLLFAVWRLLLYPLRRPITVSDLALAVENRYPDYDGRLIGAIETAPLLDEGCRNQSRALIEASLSETHSALSSTTWERLFNTTRIRRAAWGAIGMVLLIVSFSAWQPVLAGVGFARMMGGPVEWPRKTTLFIDIESDAAQCIVEADNDSGGTQKVIVAEGASLPVRISVEGRDPGSVEIVQDREGDRRVGGGSFTTTAARRAQGDYRTRIREIRSSMTFRARGGDDSGHGREVHVSVVTLPEVSGTQVVYRYPAYLGLDERRTQSAEIDAPEGTRVDLEMTLTSAPHRAELVVISENVEKRFPLVPAADEPLVVRHTMAIEKSGFYRVDLWNELEFQTLDVPVHSIICQRDEPPRIKLLSPRRKEVDVVAEGVIPFLAVAEDDYGLSRVGIEYKVAGSGKDEVIDFSGGELDADLGERQRVSRHVIDLQMRQFAFDEGRRHLVERDSIIYSLFAIDRQPDEQRGRTATGTCVIDIVSEGEKIRLLTERQIRLRRDIKRLLTQQEERRQRVAETLSDVRGGDGDDALKEQTLLFLEMGQNQLSTGFSTATREFASLFNEYLFNRIDKSTGAAALLARVLTLREAAAPSEFFSPSLYAPLGEELAGGAFGEMDVMERLFGMLHVSLQVSEELSPRAAGHLAAAVVAAESEAKTARLAQALEDQQRIVDLLRHLLERIAEWEDFQELLQMMRDVVDDQENLNKRTREWIRK